MFMWLCIDSPMGDCIDTKEIVAKVEHSGNT